MLTPKKFSSGLPIRVAVIRITATVILVVRAICLRSCSVELRVRLTKTGITPSGFTIARRVVNIFM
jgi:hypothetical protein